MWSRILKRINTDWPCILTSFICIPLVCCSHLIHGFYGFYWVQGLLPFPCSSAEPGGRMSNGSGHWLKTVKPKCKCVAVEWFASTVLGRSFCSIIPLSLLRLSRFDVKGECDIVNTSVSGWMYRDHPIKARWGELAWPCHCSFSFHDFPPQINFSIFYKWSTFPFWEHVRTICKFCSFMNIHKGLSLETQTINQNLLAKKSNWKTWSLVHFPYVWLYLMYVCNALY